MHFLGSQLKLTPKTSSPWSRS